MPATTQERIRRALPGLLRTDPESRDAILSLTRSSYPDREGTESRLKGILEQSVAVKVLNLNN